MVKRRKAKGQDEPVEAPLATQEGAAAPRKGKKRKQQGKVEQEKPEPAPSPAPASEPPKKKRKAAKSEKPSAEPAVTRAPAPELAASKNKKVKNKVPEPTPKPESAPSSSPPQKKKDAVGSTASDSTIGTQAQSGGQVTDSVDRTVFVDGVPYEWDQAKVEECFRECGAIEEVRAPVWQDTGRSRGFAHVTFSDKVGQQKALEMDGAQVGKKGRYLKIEPAKGRRTGNDAPSMDIEGKRRLFVKNLPYDALEKEVAELFKQCGKIIEVRIPTNASNVAKGFAYVEFGKTDALQAAMKMQPPPSLRGRTLRLDVDTGSGPKAGFHRREEAYGSGYGPDSVKKGKGEGKGKKGGKGRGKGPKLSLF